jgi:hypothetical protein
MASLEKAGIKVKPTRSRPSYYFITSTPATEL